MLRFDFANLLNVDLDVSIRVKSWAWFADHVSVILGHPNSMTHAHFKESHV